jgi:hypothetical protein
MDLGLCRAQKVYTSERVGLSLSACSLSPCLSCALAPVVGVPGVGVPAALGASLHCKTNNISNVCIPHACNIDPSKMYPSSTIEHPYNHCTKAYMTSHVPQCHSPLRSHIVNEDNYLWSRSGWSHRKFSDWDKVV